MPRSQATELRKNEKGFDIIVEKLVDFAEATAQQILDRSCGAVADGDPDYFGRVALQEASLPEVRVLGNNCEVVKRGISPKVGVRRRFQTCIADVTAFRVVLFEDGR